MSLLVCSSRCPLEPNVMSHGSYLLRWEQKGGGMKVRMSLSAPLKSVSLFALLPPSAGTRHNAGCLPDCLAFLIPSVPQLSLMVAGLLLCLLQPFVPLLIQGCRAAWGSYCFFIIFIFIFLFDLFCFLILFYLPSYFISLMILFFVFLFIYSFSHFIIFYFSTFFFLFSACICGNRIGHLPFRQLISKMQRWEDKMSSKR